MDKKRSSTVAAKIEKMPASTGTDALVLGRDLSVLGVHYQVAGRQKGIFSPSLASLPGQDFLMKRDWEQRFSPNGAKRCFFI